METPMTHPAGTGSATPAYAFWKAIYKCGNALEKLPGLSRLMQSAPIQRRRQTVFNAYVRRMPDRRYLDTVIIPALAHAGMQRILSVGCASYTSHNPALCAQLGMECWTTDILPENARWGNPQHHITADIKDIRTHVPPGHFDAVLFNGVMGYGVTGAMMEAVAPALHAILGPDGILVIGWNRGLVEDPCTLKAVSDRFRHTCALALPARTEINRSTHVFDWFIKSNLSAEPPS